MTRDNRQGGRASRAALLIAAALILGGLMAGHAALGDPDGADWLALPLVGGAWQPAATYQPKSTPTATPTDRVTPSSTVSPSATATSSSTPTPTPTSTATTPPRPLDAVDDFCYQLQDMTWPPSPPRRSTWW